MKLATSYLVTTKNLEAIINSILGARAPERFTNKFLEDLGFKSTNDRLYIGVFKELGLIDENSVPTKLYFEFLDQTQTRVILAESIKEAYEDLFNLMATTDDRFFQSIHAVPPIDAKPTLA